MDRALALACLLASSAALAAPSRPAATDEEVWALAQRVDTVAAYQAYLARYVPGDHRDEAVAAMNRLRGGPLTETPPVTPRRPPSAAMRDGCSPLIDQYRAGQRESAEAEAAMRAWRSNRLTDYQDFVRRFPAGACTDRINAFLRVRATRKQTLVPIAGFGPMSAHRTSRYHFSFVDYPALAMRRGESGMVTAEWEIAEDGYVEGCRILRTSGSSALDDETCRVVTARMRYDPARDASGTPIRSTDTITITWRLPQEPATQTSGTPQQP